MKYTNTTQKGFTLVETLVALTVLLVALGGPLGVASQGLNSAANARDQAMATYLAQEAVEFIRAQRDDSVRAGEEWISGFSQCFGVQCIVDPLGNFIIGCDSSCTGRLMFNPDTGFYRHNVTGSPWEPSIFTRLITITPLLPSGAGTDEVVITVTVSWRQGRATHSFAIRENLFRWQ